ncbi:8-oxo-dGDP phosphatase NUDT18-like isoform X1 [Mya arenaria]|uniref:8-oxo-dGDP phosphatase NUDT18-like isoform X1 n=1 Tax=Mya arenaria TaxID=6604 RepID=UPI0022E2E384|nr:8-oxo-dGDP phosphatase NUDT18-like isoform X1 [Mya arenaria]
MSGSIEEDLKLLLDGKVVPIHQDEDIVTKYLVQQETDYVPIVKRTVGYIAMGLVFNEAGQLLLMQEAKERIRGQWYIPAGRMEPGENFIDGVKREILEEAGVEVDVVSLVAIEMYDSLSWFRICFIARPSGGKLKTLAEQDEESLQAQWFDIDKIKNGTLNLRGQDFFKVMDLAQDYLSRSKDCQHPAYQVGIQPHRHLLQRPVILRRTHNGSVDVLCSGKGRHCLPVIQLNPKSMTLFIALKPWIQEIFQTSSTTQLKSEGMLTLEHCGIPSREHDGLCVTVVYIVPEHLLDTLVEVKHADYAWHTLTDSQLLEEMDKRIFSKNLLIPIVGN